MKTAQTLRLIMIDESSVFWHIFQFLNLLFHISCLLFPLTTTTEFLSKETKDRSFLLFFSGLGMRPRDHDTDQGRKSCAIENHLERSSFSQGWVSWAMNLPNFWHGISKLLYINKLFDCVEESRQRIFHLPIFTSLNHCNQRQKCWHLKLAENVCFLVAPNRKSKWRIGTCFLLKLIPKSPV